jgi:NCS2 family nucleobase:cation symporter-2
VIGFATAAILLAFAFLPKITALFLLIPQSVAGPLLVFTACFMISGGMQIMLSRPLDTRAAYVIGIATLLALSESVFPAYFEKMPATLRSITESPLAFSLGAAVVLTLLFRIGTRQTARVAWNDSVDAIESAIVFLRGKAGAWNVAPTVLDAAAIHAREVIEFVSRHHSLHSNGELTATYNGMELRLDIDYQGSPTTQLPYFRCSRFKTVTDFEDEEAAAYLGLRSFVDGLAADRHETKAKKGTVKIRLFYAV